jgi:hypothetical protein
VPAIRELGYSTIVIPDIYFLRTRTDHSVMASDCHSMGQTRDYVKGGMTNVVEQVLERKCSDTYRVGRHISVGCEVSGLPPIR